MCKAQAFPGHHTHAATRCALSPSLVTRTWRPNALQVPRPTHTHPAPALNAPQLPPLPQTLVHLHPKTPCPAPDLDAGGGPAPDICQRERPAPGAACCPLQGQRPRGRSLQVPPAPSSLPTCGLGQPLAALSPVLVPQPACTCDERKSTRWGVSVDAGRRQ